MACVGKKQLDKFCKETGYTFYTNEFGVRKDYKKRNDWRFVPVKQLLKDFVKWKEKNY